ncbi:MAG TPA: hypothetical protein VKW06_21040 [Candidatus Angelobacter sp.]|nr:hypothetical protein [Candidatus Angelobacter sp.]
MNRVKIFVIAAALMTGGSALATAQPFDHDGRRDGDRYEHRDRDDRRFRDRDDYRRVDRDDFRFRDRGDYRYVAGERRFFNGYYWTWDGSRWCRNANGVTLYFGF